ncbi:putative serine protease K12H4.7 [Trichechus manatus latirostris]|uniref:Serine protease K12H4.7 n=1 Tax=Trichechus manatus latirostris TaxID=127582 RepID=A0A2Y9FX29_TRIMA|nr:putative serine protease K12H4.7 [Trichechus manatus latirostris]
MVTLKFLGGDNVMQPQGLRSSTDACQSGTRVGTISVEIAQTVETASHKTTMARSLEWLQLSLLLLLFCSCAQSFLQRQTRGNVTRKENGATPDWFLQKLDHFSKKKLTSWTQTFYVNKDFYKPGGPVFLMIEGRRPASMQWINKNYTWITYAKRLGALCFLLEHRFYGSSLPTADLRTPNLRRYLSSRQAVADIAEFRTKVAQEMRLTGNKWVLFGGGYGGSLAVWSKIKHPNLFAAVVSSSAPVQAKADFYEYFDETYKALAAHNRECLKAVKEAYGLVGAMLLLPDYHRKLKFDYKLCEPLTINSEMDQLFILEKIMILPAAVVQSNTRSKTVEGLTREMRIDEFCEKMTNTSMGSPYHRFANVISTMLKNKDGFCLSANYNESRSGFSAASVEMNNYFIGRPWFFQCCTELGYFFTTSLRNHSFSGLPLRYYVKKCADVFGPDININSITRGAMATNRYYDGLKVRGSKIIFANGSYDPWHRLGITKDISKDLRAVFIRGESHCEDMLEPQDTDSAELIQAREKIFQILQKWLRE